MSDTEPVPEISGVTPPVIDHAPAAKPVAASRRRGGTPLPLTLLLTAGLGGGLYWVWTNPKPVQTQGQADPQPALDAMRAQVAASLQSQAQASGQQIQALAGRLDAIEKQPARPAETPAGSATAADQARKLDDIAGRLDALEKRPSASAEPAAQGVSAEAVADQAKKLDDVAGRVDAVSAKQDAQAAEIQKAAEIAAQRPPTPAAAPPDTAAQQVPALIAQQQAADLDSKLGQSLAEQKAVIDQARAQQTAALDGLSLRLAKLEQANSQAGEQEHKQAEQQSRSAQQSQEQAKDALTTLNTRVQKLEQDSGQASEQAQEHAHEQAAQEDQAAQHGQEQAKAALAALDTRVEKLEQGAGQAQTVAQDASRAIRIEAAQAALAAGQPLGAIPGAPPALARFATVAPPTEAVLREDFPGVAAAAKAASQPDLSHRSFLDRALARVQQSVTVRRGDRVLVGDPASGVLVRAQDALAAGDLRGAADSLAGLNGAAAAATRDWVDRVHALLEARASLAAMAHG